MSVGCCRKRRIVILQNEVACANKYSRLLIERKQVQQMNMQELKKLIYQGEKVDIECKKAEKSVPKSAYESYSAFANTKGGYIILGVREDKTKTDPKERFIIQGIEDAPKQKEDFWNTINGNKVNINLLTDDDVKIVEDGSIKTNCDSCS